MIYSITRNRPIQEYYNQSNIAQNQERARQLDRLEKSIGDSENFSWKICIPKKYARLESTKRINTNEVEAVDHYEIYVTKQVGTSRNRRSAFLYFKLPTCDKLFTLVLHMDGGVSFQKHEHKFILRVSDEIDRRIILGFCKLYQHNLRNYCYSDSSTPDPWILYNAATYTIDEMPKRIKVGSSGNNFNYRNLKPYEENTIFNRVHVI